MTTSAGRFVVIGLVIAVVIVAIVGGFLILGSPAEERLRQLDNRRVNDLMRISKAIDVYWTRHKRLPVSMDELTQERGLSLNVRDPVTAQLYEYRALEDSTYELCATFQRDSTQESARHGAGRQRSELQEYMGYGKDFWSHGAGRQCFELVARKVKPEGIR